MNFMIICLVGKLSIIFSLFFAGIMKVIWYKNTIYSIKNMDIFPKKVSGYIAVIMPIFEIIGSITMVIINNKIIEILIIIYLVFFISLNFKFVLEKKSQNCCCYGKLISSKLGRGGLILYIYLLFIFIISMLGKNNFYQLLEYRLRDIVIVCLLSLMVMINGLVIRKNIEAYMD